MRLLLACAVALCQAAPAAAPGAASVRPAAWSRIPAERRADFEQLGFHPGADGAAVTPEGAPLSTDALARWLAPVDARAETLTDDDRTSLLLGNYRFLADGRVLSASTHRPIARVTFAALKAQMAATNRRNALERLVLLFGAADQGRPLPPSEQKRALKIAESAEGLPPSLLADLASAQTLSATLRAQAEQGYLGAMRAYDGALTPAEVLDRLAPLRLPPPDAAPKPHFDRKEGALGRALTAATERVLSRNPIGAQLLASFGPPGKRKLPSFYILPLPSDSVGMYSDGRILISEDVVVGWLVNRAPIGLRSALLEQLSDSAAVSAYLLARPAELDAFIAEHDGVFVHELEHARQHRTEPYLAHVDRGNAPAADFIEEEWQAYLVQMRYLHEKLKASPAAAIDEDELARYRRFIADFDGWRDDIAQRYLQDDPDKAATLATGLELQRARSKASWTILLTDPSRAKLEALKIAGLAQGTKALAEFQARSHSQLAAFESSEYPSLKREGNRSLALVFESRARREPQALQRREFLRMAYEYADAAGDAALKRRIDAERAGMERRP